MVRYNYARDARPPHCSIITEFCFPYFFIRINVTLTFIPKKSAFISTAQYFGWQDISFRLIRASMDSITYMSSWTLLQDLYNYRWPHFLHVRLVVASHSSWSQVTEYVEDKAPSVNGGRVHGGDDYQHRKLHQCLQRKISITSSSPILLPWKYLWRTCLRGDSRGPLLLREELRHAPLWTCLGSQLNNPSMQ